MRKILLIVLILVIPVSSITGKLVSSPINPKYQAKITQTEFDGQQLFVSYDGGKNFERITWPWFGNDLSQEDQGQVMGIEWLPNGLLVLWVDHIFVSVKIDKNYHHTFSDARSIGIFDPNKKILYWIAGFYAKPVWGSDDVSDIKISDDKISYKLIRSSANKQEVFEKKVKVTPKLLENSNQDFSPRVIYFGWQLIGALRKSADVKPFLSQIRNKDQSRLQIFLAKNNPPVAKHLKVTKVEIKRDRSGKRYYQLVIVAYLDGNPIPFGGSEAQSGRELHLLYDSMKQYYEVSMLEYLVLPGE